LIPLMTNEGTFLVNGIERVIINQIVRSPGVYYKKEINSRKYEVQIHRAYYFICSWNARGN
jgi:DNA-directed RNA polymerase beta subunit